MGIVSKNSIINSIISYTGLCIGAYNIIYLFGQYLNSNEIGTIFLLIAFSKTFAGIAGFGFNQGIIKFNPYFNRNKKYFLKILSLLTGSLFIFCLIFWLTNAENLFFSGNLDPLKEHYIPIYIASISLVFYNILEAYSISNLDVVKVSITREIIPRISLTILVFFYSNKLISFEIFLLIYSITNIISILILLPSIRNSWLAENQNNTFNFKYLSLYYKFSSFIYLATIVSVVAENSDLLIIGQKISIENAGLFQIASYLATLIIIPYRTLSLTTSPVISNAWKNKNLNLLNEIYKKTSEVQWFLGISLFCFITINFQTFSFFYPGKSNEIFNIFVILGLVKLIDMGFGQNSEIIINSSSWKTNFTIQIVVLILFISSNILLVGKFGAIGSAYASIISFLSLNLFRFAFLFKKYKLFPFSLSTLKIPLISLTILLYNLNLDNEILNFIIKNLLFILIISSFVFVFNVSPEINKHLKKIINGLVFPSIKNF